MEINKQDKKVSVSMSQAEWRNIGKKAGWLKSAQTVDPVAPVSQPASLTPTPPPAPVAKPKRPAYDTIKYTGDINDDIFNYMDQNGERFVDSEMDGIGAYEFQGQKGFDKGTRNTALNEVTVAVDVTGSQYDESQAQQMWEEVPDVQGSFDYGDDLESITIYYTGHGNVQDVNGRKLAIYTLTGGPG